MFLLGNRSILLVPPVPGTLISLFCIKKSTLEKTRMKKYPLTVNAARDLIRFNLILRNAHVST